VDLELDLELRSRKCASGGTSGRCERADVGLELELEL
jgi:hypothetical protein